MKRKKIVWDSDQLMAVARRAHSIRGQPGFSGTDLQAVRQAQEEVLPAHLQRPLKSLQEAPRLIFLLKQPNCIDTPGVVQPIRPVQPATTPLSEESTENLMSEVMRRMVREEVSRALESREPVSPANVATNGVPGFHPSKQWFKVY